MARPRRKSSNLGGEIRGDTGAPGFSTVQLKSAASSPPPTPQPTEKTLTKRGAKRRKARSLLRRWMQMSIKHTWLNPLVIICAVLTLYGLNPTESNPLHSAIFLSYPEPPLTDDGPTMYGKGKCDIAFVAFYIVFFTFTREFTMQRLIRPTAIRWGIRSRGKLSRFMEQAYTALYFAFFGPFGLYVMSRSSLWYFNTAAMFEGFPHRSHEGLFKAYYLLQASYWAQQAIVLMMLLEKPRKDFKELVLHHIITLALIGLSYRFHFTHMGLAVYITHDISDFFLATSKTLNYLDHPAIGPYFAFFVCMWIYMRHYLNLRILWATLTEFRTVGPFELDWETQQYKCWISQYITFALLLSLQLVNLFWLYLILRIAVNYVFANDRQDVRSDDEDDDLVEEADAKSARENERSMKSDKPVVLVNGHAVEDKKAVAKAEGITERRKKR